MTENGSPYDAAWDAIDDGRPEEALHLAAAAGEDGSGERALVEGQASLELGMHEAAKGALERARTARGADDIEVRELHAELALAQWDLETAAATYESLAGLDFEPTWWQRRMLLADLAGDTERADSLHAEAKRLAPDIVPTATRLTDSAFDRVVEEALGELPEVFRRAVDAARVVREPVPWKELAQAGDVEEIPADLLGLFVGPTLQELAEGRSAELPPTIYLFQRNLERAVHDRDELREQIRITLFHEIGHLLGLDEDEVAAMGLA